MTSHTSNHKYAPAPILNVYNAIFDNLEYTINDSLNTAIDNGDLLAFMAACAMLEEYQFTFQYAELVIATDNIELSDVMLDYTTGYEINDLLQAAIEHDSINIANNLINRGANFENVSTTLDLDHDDRRLLRDSGLEIPASRSTMRPQ